jgi:hypothetical protein
MKATVKSLFIKEFSSYFKTPLGYVFLVTLPLNQAEEASFI